MLKKILLVPFVLMVWQLNVMSQSILAPSFSPVEINNPGQFFCQPDGMNVIFKGLNFNTGNIFYIQLSDETGDFANPTIIGQLADTGSNLVPIVCTIPANFVCGTQHRIRIKSTDPEVTSEVNQFPFIVVPGLQAGLSPDEYGIDKWLAHVHYWSSTVGNITDPIANNINFFNAAKYVARFGMDSLSFNLNFGITAPGRGTPALQNFQGCTKSDFFSIRFRRTMHLDSGFYSFKVSGDDGFRLSIDGGATWIIRSWREQSITTTCYNNCCGIFVPGGMKNLVLEYFEKKDLSSCALTILKAGPPGIISDPDALDGSTVCANKKPFQLSLTPKGGIYSGEGVNPGGMFNPSVGNSGPRTITYQTGIVPCLRTKIITINILPGPFAQISGLDSVYCVSQGSVSFSTTPSGGTLFGSSGLVGNTFNPSTAGEGIHTIKYAIPDAIGNCPDTAVWTIRVKPGTPILVSVSDSVVCQNGLPITFSGTPDGGIFEGPGVDGNSFNPSGLSPGLYQLLYRVVGTASCGDSTLTFRVRVKSNPNASITNLPTTICGNGLPITLVPAQLGGVFSGAGISGSIFNPQDVPDSLKVLISYRIELEGCIDSSSQTIAIERPLTPQVSLSGWSPANCSTDSAFTIVALPPGGTLYSNGVIINPTINPATTDAGTYQLTYVFKPASACLDTLRASGEFMIFSSPVISGLHDTTLARGASIQLNATGARTYQWTPTIGLNNPNVSNPVASPTSTTTYVVEGTDVNGFCTGRTSFTISVIDPIFIPNLITANNDGKNDGWVIQGLLSRALKKVEIYDRWGRKVFEDSDYLTPWDGKVDGKIQSGTYFFNIDFETDADIKGILTVVSDK